MLGGEGEGMKKRLDDDGFVDGLNRYTIGITRCWHMVERSNSVIR